MTHIHWWPPNTPLNRAALVILCPRNDLIIHRYSLGDFTIGTDCDARDASKQSPPQLPVLRQSVHNAPTGPSPPWVSQCYCIEWSPAGGGHGARGARSDTPRLKGPCFYGHPTPSPTRPYLTTDRPWAGRTGRQQRAPPPSGDSTHNPPSHTGSSRVESMTCPTPPESSSQYRRALGCLQRPGGSTSGGGDGV